MATPAWYEEDDIPSLRWYCDESGLGEIYPRQIEGEWEYWFVFWCYRKPTVNFILRGGQKWNEDGTPWKG